MEITPELISELKTLFIKDIGRIAESASIELYPIKEPCLAFSGEGIKQENGSWILDFGEIPAIARISRTVSVQNAGQIPVSVLAQGGSPRLGFRWKNSFLENVRPCGDFREMEIVFRGKDLTNSPVDEDMIFFADAFSKEKTSGVREKFILRVIASPHCNLPFGVFDFNGLRDCDSHDFGVINPAGENVSIPEYRLSITNAGGKPLTFHLDNIPNWLNISTSPPGILSRSGKGIVEPGNDARIIRIAPKISIGPPKTFQSRMVLKTNDFRPEFKRIEMVFHCRQQIIGSYVLPGKKESICIQILSHAPGFLEFPILNMGQQPAAVRFEANDLIEPGTLIVPPARTKGPGQGVIKARIAAEDKEPGKHTTALKISVQNDKSPPLMIPVESDIIQIICTPDAADFGTVSPGDTPEQKFTFRVSGGYKLNLQANVNDRLKDSLQLKADKNDMMTVRLRDAAKQDNPLPAFDGPGIQVRDPNLGYQHSIHIKFRRTSPVFETAPEINLGDIMSIGTSQAQCFFYNRGDGILKAQFRSLSPDLIIPKSSATIELGPSQKTNVVFSLTFIQNVGNGPIQRAFAIRVNDPRMDLDQKVRVRANVVQAAGRVCPQCPYKIVLPLAEKHCRFCGISLADAEAVTVEGINVCGKCGRQYKSNIKFCPADGKPLKPLKA